MNELERARNCAEKMFAGDRNRYVIVGIAGKGKCRIGKRKNEAAVADVEAVEHVITHPH